MSRLDDREYVARLIVSVLTERMSVREAILQFPKDTTDKNIITAYHALIHYEADEDERAMDLAYREEQDEYLNMIAELLAAGKELPKNIIKSYEPYYPEVQFQLPKSKTFKNFLKTMCRFLNVK